MRRGLTAAGPRRPHLCGLRFFVLRRPGAPAAPEPGPRAEGKASEPDTRSPARHAAPISRRTTKAAIYAASVFLTSAAPAPRQLQSRSPPPWSGTDTPAVPKPGLAPQGKHRSSARNIPAARHPHHPEPAGKAFPSPAPAVSHRPSRSSYPPGSLKRSGPRTGTASLHPRPRRRPESARHTHPAPAPKAPSRTSLRLPYTPTTRRGSAPKSNSRTRIPPAAPHFLPPLTPASTKKPPPSPEPPPFIHILNTPPPRHPHFPEPAGKKHPLPAPPSTPAPPEKAPSRTPSQTPLCTHTRRGRAPEPAPPHIRILARTIRPPRTGREKAPSSCHAFHTRATPHPSPPFRTNGSAPEPDTRSPARHAASIRRRTTEAAISAASVFYLPPPHPGCSGILSATRSGTNPPPHTDSRLPDDTSVQHSLAPRPPLRRPNQPPTHTSCRASPRPPPRQTQKSGSRHRNRHPTSASSPAPSAPRTGWEKAPSSCHVFHVRAARKSAAPHLSPPPHIRILAHLHLSPTPCSRAPPKLPLSPPRNARKNVTPHPAGRRPAPSRTSKCLPSPAGTKKAAAR